MYKYNNEAVTRKSLLDTLSYCSEKELPKEWDGKKVWITAIVLVSKKDGGLYYGIAIRGADGDPMVVKDFGGISAIHKVEKIYPFEFLRDYYIECNKGKTKQQKIDFVRNNDLELKKVDLSAKSAAEIDEILTQTLIKIQVRNERGIGKQSKAADEHDSCTEQGQQVGGEDGQGTVELPQGDDGRAMPVEHID